MDYYNFIIQYLFVHALQVLVCCVCACVPNIMNNIRKWIIYWFEIDIDFHNELRILQVNYVVFYCMGGFLTLYGIESLFGNIFVIVMGSWCIRKAPSANNRYML